jgi:hypothetical protein
VRLRKQLPRQVKRSQWGQPGLVLDFTNEPLLYDFLQEAMGAVLLLFTALDNYANESMPDGFEAPDDAGKLIGRKQIETKWGLPRRLGKVLPTVSGKSSIETTDPDVWTALETLKDLRDSIGHTHSEETYNKFGDDPNQGLFSRLMAADLLSLHFAVETTMDYYGRNLGGIG